MVATIAALVLAACGGSSDATAEATAEQTPEAATSTPRPAATTAPTSEAPEAITVASAGGSAASGEISISIPADALPDGVSPSDVSIEAISADDLILSVENAEVVAAYRLLPDGLVLSEPATVALRVPVEQASGGLALLHLNSEGPSPLDKVTVTVDGAGEVATVETMITHFSDLAALQMGFFTVEVFVAKNVFTVGDTFGAGVRVNPTGATFSLRSEGSGTVYSTDSVFVDGFWTGHSPAITPNLIRDRPSYAPLGAQYENNELFVCAEESSSFSVAHHAQIEYGFKRTITAADGSTETQIAAIFGLTTIDLVDSEPIDCVLVEPIQALLADGTTIYSVNVDPDSGYRFAWSGPDCGSTSALNASSMSWSHKDDEGCEHGGDIHKGTLITLTVTGDDFEVRCTYPGADTGTGPPCKKQE